jgi:hypothetical protein
MAATQQQTAVFSTAEAQRFAALMAGFDTQNGSEDEALAKGRMLRRMAEKKHFRLIDAFELPEIRHALDQQMQPDRKAVPDTFSLQTELEELRGKLGMVVPKLNELTEALVSSRRKAAYLVALFYATFFVSCGLAIYAGPWSCLVANGMVCAVGSVVLANEGLVERRLMDLEMVKEKALLVYAWATNICFGLNALTYIACCIVAGGPVGPVGYIGWLYHCCQWSVSHG